MVCNHGDQVWVADNEWSLPIKKDKSPLIVKRKETKNVYCSYSPFLDCLKVDCHIIKSRGNMSPHKAAPIYLLNPPTEKKTLFPSLSLSYINEIHCQKSELKMLRKRKKKEERERSQFCLNRAEAWVIMCNLLFLQFTYNVL
jgi:hypothetical protein